MSTNSVATHATDTPSIARRMVDAARRAADVSHESRSIAGLAEEAVENGVDVTRRTVRSVRRGLEKLQDDSTYYVRRHALKTIGIAAGIGVCVGIATGWIAASLCSASRRS